MVIFKVFMIALQIYSIFPFYAKKNNSIIKISLNNRTIINKIFYDF